MTKVVFILGGTGYVGEAIVAELLSSGYKVLVLARHNWEDRVEIPQVKQAFVDGKIRVIEGDAKNISETKVFAQIIQAALEKDEVLSAVVYSIGLIREFPAKGIYFAEAHHQWVGSALKLTTELHIPRFVLISAAGVEKAQTAYQRTKLMGENLVQEFAAAGKLKATIFRPATMIGPSRKYHFMQVLRDLTKFPVVPVVGSGKFTLAPLSRRQLGQAVSNILVNSKADNASALEIYTLTGRDLITFKALLQLVKSSKGEVRAIYVNVPFALLKLMGKIFRYLPSFPVTDEQLVMLKLGRDKDWQLSTADKGDWQRLGIEPKPLQEIIDSYKY